MSIRVHYFESTRTPLESLASKSIKLAFQHLEVNLIPIDFLPLELTHWDILNELTRIAVEDVNEDWLVFVDADVHFYSAVPNIPEMYSDTLFVGDIIPKHHNPGLGVNIAARIHPAFVWVNLKLARQLGVFTPHPVLQHYACNSFWSPIHIGHGVSFADTGCVLYSAWRKHCVMSPLLDDCYYHVSHGSYGPNLYDRFPEVKSYHDQALRAISSTDTSSIKELKRKQREFITSNPAKV